ncbi:hypothetical protein C8R43DRAFT_942379 [Mycena crocata]|nr:hypothetical protein C8R43DRAFT_942379 [Mycena crocata]
MSSLPYVALQDGGGAVGPSSSWFQPFRAPWEAHRPSFLSIKALPSTLNGVTEVLVSSGALKRAGQPVWDIVFPLHVDVSTGTVLVCRGAVRGAFKVRNILGSRDGIVYEYGEGEEVVLFCLAVKPVESCVGPGGARSVVFRRRLSSQQGLGLKHRRVSVGGYLYQENNAVLLVPSKVTIKCLGFEIYVSGGQNTSTIFARLYQALGANRSKNVTHGKSLRSHSMTKIDSMGCGEAGERSSERIYVRGRMLDGRVITAGIKDCESRLWTVRIGSPRPEIRVFLFMASEVGDVVRALFPGGWFRMRLAVLIVGLAVDCWVKGRCDF